MANHCYNYALLHGPKDALDMLEERFKSVKENLWADTYPIVLGITDKTDDVYADYGSRWFDATLDRNSDHEAAIYGDSAWSPVNAFLLKLSKVYHLTISSEYEEPGIDFGGFFDCKDGDVTRHDEYEYNEFMMLSGNQEQVFSDMKYNIEDGLYDSFNEFCTDHMKVMKKLSDEDVAHFKSLFENYKKNEEKD
jgi:hypothetical protein